MVTHETYKAPDGQWLSPEEVSNGTVIATGEPVTLGRVEKMSKSKKNTVDPGPIVDQYGADAVRWFMLSDSPPERDLEWTESGIEGCWRFVNRLWRITDAPEDSAGSAGEETRKIGISTANFTRRSPGSPPISKRSVSTGRSPRSTSWPMRSRRRRLVRQPHRRDRAP